ncbi:hypothetical protein [Legionella quateirensis]|uniref:Uncharacterized protein n=1 Tax=Legionella quateirensis TaxID=45072 RepID=A0A378KRE5_9GAMM|nr:hypothetical protein [Legionella quateirensis]KTD51299.1 hypothetical protein Lqua_1526 [Legionella quateirensis]STY17454.1 Uncharacterised protein [Legionella quateirensis]
MKVTLFRDDYESISQIVRDQLRQLMPDNEFAQTEYLLFGPEFMAQPLRISTPSTNFDFDPVHTGYINILKDEINSTDDSPENKQLKKQQLESIILFGQILFSQSASLHFLNKSAIDASLEEDNPIALKIERLRTLVQKEGIQFESSKLEALSRRKEFNDELTDLKRTIKDSSLDEENKAQLLDNLSKTKDFYYQANDFNFKYANKPSRSYSNFVNNCERLGSKIALTASLVAIGATALSLVPAFAPVMIPIALAASTISLVIGLPLALKKVGTMLYNLIRFGAAPTPGELITTALLGTSLIMAGVSNVIGQAVNSGVLSKTAQLITQAVAAVSNLGKAAIGIAGQNISEEHLDKVEFYKSELVRLKPQEQGLELNMQNSEEVNEAEKVEAVEAVEDVEEADSHLDSGSPGMQLS